MSFKPIEGVNKVRPLKIGAGQKGINPEKDKILAASGTLLKESLVWEIMFNHLE